MSPRTKHAGLLTLIFVGAVVALSLSSQALDDRPTRAEVEKIAERVTATQAPYLADRKALSNDVAEIKAASLAWIAVVEANTEAQRKNTEAQRLVARALERMAAQ